jgi:hypothetical protein
LLSSLLLQMECVSCSTSFFASSSSCWAHTQIRSVCLCELWLQISSLVFFFVNGWHNQPRVFNSILKGRDWHWH